MNCKNDVDVGVGVFQVSFSSFQIDPQNDRGENRPSLDAKKDVFGSSENLFEEDIENLQKQKQESVACDAQDQDADADADPDEEEFGDFIS